MRKVKAKTAKDKGLKVVKAAQTPKADAAKSKFLGTSDLELQLQLMLESTSLMGITVEDVKAGKADHAGACVAAAIGGIDPQDELQGLLAIQMFGTHNLAMSFCRKLFQPGGQTIEVIDTIANRATQFMKLFLEQAICLQKLKGQAAQQRVVVEHVHVHQGGQAIVGAVTPRGEGEG